MIDTLLALLTIAFGMIGFLSVILAISSLADSKLFTYFGCYFLAWVSLSLAYNLNKEISTPNLTNLVERIRQKKELEKHEKTIINEIREAKSSV